MFDLNNIKPGLYSTKEYGHGRLFLLSKDVYRVSGLDTKYVGTELGTIFYVISSRKYSLENLELIAIKVINESGSLGFIDFAPTNKHVDFERLI